MHVVVDANVVVSGIFWAGTPGRILDAWTAGAFTLPVTEPILDEYFEVIDRIAAKIGRMDLATAWKTSLFDHGEMVKVTYRYDNCRDPDDAKFVECAVSAGASYIVTGASIDRDSCVICPPPDLPQGLRRGSVLPGLNRGLPRTHWGRACRRETAGVAQVAQAV